MLYNSVQLYIYMYAYTVSLCVWCLVYIYTCTGCLKKLTFLFLYSLLKNHRAQNKLYNILGIVLPVQKCVCQNGKTIPKVLYSLFWALIFLNGYKNKKVNFFKHPVLFNYTIPKK